MNEKFKILRDEINKRIENERKKSPGAPSGAVSVADEIRKLKALADEGILTEDEFQAKKRTLLS